MSEERNLPADAERGARPGWLSNRRSLIKTATGLAAAGVVGSALTEAGGTASANSVGMGPASGGRATRDVISASPEFFVTITGAKQGKFKGESTLKSHEDAIGGLSFHYQVTSPRDIATGQASGKRQHQPITITKEWGAATPQILQAEATNELLTEVMFTFTDGGADGQASRVHYTIKLTNATISRIEQYIDHASTDHRNSEDSRRLEDVSFVFRKIEFDDKIGGKSAVDDWSA